MIKALGRALEKLTHNKGTIQFNGKVIKIPSGKSISIINGQIFVDGVLYTDGDFDKRTILVIDGTITNLKCDQSVSVNGDVGSIESLGSVGCDNVKGNINSKGSVNCDAVTGSVYAGGSVNCDRVSGSVTARFVNHD